jgi:hypothetical protein
LFLILSSWMAFFRQLWWINQNFRGWGYSGLLRRETEREREREEKWNRQRLSEIDVHDGQVLTSSKSFSILFLFFQNPWPWLRQSLYTARICSRSCASSTQ